MLLDLSQLDRNMRDAVSKFFKEDFDAKLLQAVAEQRAVAAHYHQNPHQYREGIGQKTMAVHPLFDWVARQKYGEDTRDPNFWKWVAKKEDAFRVKAVPHKIQSGWRPTPDTRTATKRSVKKYE
jgi:hypothetical protein